MKKTWREVHGIEEEVAQDSHLKNNQQQSCKKKRPAHLSAPRLTEKFTVSRARPAHTTIRTKSLQEDEAQTLNPNNGSKLKSAMKATCSTTTEPLPADFPLKHSTMQGTASAKLSYLIDRVIALHTKEKILIFYDGDQIAYYIAQAFEILDIRFLIYTRTLDLALKNAYIATFNAISTFRVMLMNIHEAAHGLHIASASRVFFVNPIWQPNVEAQAIKRAHRIGQTRPVYVETLVLRDTLEDQMLQRRKGMTAQEHLKAEKSLLDDDTMSSIIKNARLISLFEDDLSAVSAQVAKLENPQPLFGQTSTGVGDAEDPYADLIFPVETPKAIRKSPERLAKLKNTQAPSESSLKRKSDLDHAPDFGSPTPTKRINAGLALSISESAPPAVLHSGDSLTNGTLKRVGFALDDGEPEHDSLFGSNAASIGSASAAGPSSKRIKLTSFCE